MPLLRVGRIRRRCEHTGEVAMKTDKEIERLRQATAVRAAHFEEKAKSRDLAMDGFNASEKREALKLLQSAVSAEKHAKIAA